MPSLKIGNFDGWVPTRVQSHDGHLQLHWMRLGKIRYAESFFDNAISRSLSGFRHGIERRITSMDEFADAFSPDLATEPSGFIFHLSRCGSTLASQLLSTLAGSTVISEAPPIDAVLRANLHDATITEEQRIHWLRAVLAALRHSGVGTRHFFVKFDAWNTLELPLIRRAYPSVPWIFVCREPLEVLRSHAKIPGSHMVQGVIEPETYGWRQPVPIATQTEYGAAVLLAICNAALSAMQGVGGGRVVDYGRLPAAMWTDLPHLFGIVPSEEETGRMKHASQYDAKHPSEHFRRADSIPFPPLSSATSEQLALSYSRLLACQ